MSKRGKYIETEGRLVRRIRGLGRNGGATANGCGVFLLEVMNMY